MVVSYIFLFIWAFVVLFPFYWLGVTAFKLPIDVSSGPKYLPFVDFKPSTHAFEELLFETENFVSRPYMNTVSIALTSSICTIVIGSLAAYALTRFNYQPKPGLVVAFAVCIGIAILLIHNGMGWRPAVIIATLIYLLVAVTIGRRFRGGLTNDDVAFWLVSQRMLPPVAVILPIYMMFQQLDLLNTRIAIIITYTAANLPLAIWFMRDYFLSIPIELEESAFIDGASRYQVFWRIVMPLAVPGLVATFLIVLVFAWNEYLLGLYLSGPNTQMMPQLVAAQNATRGPQWWNISALVLMMVGPIVLLAIALERFIARGILVGAVKG
ncbi:MAG: carbohydrate ABC transporter permease [Chloroflexi bacterium]|nr:carbohydrate ABC transporter permease [Chloroflexota bacterium]